jgi:hypothetical protein
MPLHDLASGIERNLIERIRELADAAANGWNHATLLQHPSMRKPPPRGCPAHLRPERKHLSRWNHAPIQPACSHTQILYFSSLMPDFRGVRVHPQSRYRCRRAMGEFRSGMLRMPPNPSANIPCNPRNLQQCRLQTKHRRREPSRNCNVHCR